MQQIINTSLEIGDSVYFEWHTKTFDGCQDLIGIIQEKPSEDSFLVQTDEQGILLITKADLL